MFREVTSDFQDVTVQGQVVYRVTAPQTLTGLMNFSLAPNGTYAAEDPRKLPQRVMNAVQVQLRAILQTQQELLRGAEELVGAVDEAGRLYRVIVSAGTPGLDIVDNWSGIGQRTTASGTVTLRAVRVPDDHAVAVHEFISDPNLYGTFSQFYQAAIDLGIARRAFREMLRFVRESARPWIDFGKDTAAEDMLTIGEVGALQYRLHAAEAMMERAGEQLDRAAAALDATGQAASSIAVAEAKVLTTEIALEAASKLFELGGARAALAAHGFDRYWRDARVHTLHDPVRWKVHAIGDHALNGSRLPLHAWI